MFPLPTYYETYYTIVALCARILPLPPSVIPRTRIDRVEAKRPFQQPTITLTCFVCFVDCLKCLARILGWTAAPRVGLKISERS